MIKVKQFEFSMFGVNTYVIEDEATKEAAVVDPAMATAAEQKRFDDYITEHGLKVTQIINTHLHLDHCFGENYVRDKYGVPVKAHLDDASLGINMEAQYRKFGLLGKGADITIDAPLADGDVVEIGQSILYVIHVPGHSPGGIALYNPETKLLLTGDSLFHRSIGRTDLPGGNAHQLIDSVKSRLLSLPDDTVVLPGHGEATTVGYEKKANPFVQ